ncbi:DNA repair/transcription protein MET18/MMS19 [Fistulifera solaris]|uniref:MMS19 nucleotide excision repair protein n=1 Tax=Fistulifera solaris TaxID=1519565 RepID=A0A1Z5JPX6_FISSO|nr:DNA repair/transcription protein MET18/MMS19 [Fistulifera solaris]|eukprot:GAX15818.1 DNA repair/transcription protein MET18/MMS19 [Fistulifera solaris]
MSVVSEATQISTALSGTTEELFRIWKDACLASSTNANAQREESRNFFRSILKGTRVVTDEGFSLSTKSSHEELLALLIQQLGPAFSGSLSARLVALACLRGALEACQRMPLSLTTTRLLGNFYQEHCGPVEPDPEEDRDEQIRDEAMEGLHALVRLPMDPNVDLFDEFVQIRLQYTLISIQRRCAVPEDNEWDQYKSNNLSGLSVLPRTRRSLCFQLLRAAIDSIAEQYHKSSTSQLTLATQQELQRFATFAARCLQGESDPRCLMQLLQVLNTMLVAFRPLVSTMPIGEIFEVVAPYYPIQFTPPPNDTHGITREGLRGALSSILRNFDYDDALVQAGEDSMIRLSLGLVLEVLVPPPGDGPPTTKELREGLEDLESMLFDSGSDRSRIGLLAPAQLRDLSDALVIVHDQTSSAAGGKESQDTNHVLADQCRDLISRIAAHAERVSRDHWSAFVGDTLKTMCSKMQSPSQKRVAIAYAACLCSCGGPQTLRQTLEDFLELLLQQLDSAPSEEADVASSLYGVGAFFSSTVVALEKAKEQGVAIVPHPLAPYSATALDKVLSLLNALPPAESWTGVRIAAIRTIESILINSPPGSLEDHSEHIDSFLQSLLQVVCDDGEMAGPLSWTQACAEVTGRMLGKALSDTEALQSMSTPLFFKSEALSRLVSSSCLPRIDERNDQSALGLATTSSLSSASSVVHRVAGKMMGALGEHKLGEVEQCARLLSLIFIENGSFSARAFQKLDTPGCTAVELLDKLAVCYSKDLACMADLETGLNKVLPIASFLAAAYKRVAVAEHVEALIQTIFHSSIQACESKEILKNVIGTVFLSSALCHDGLLLGSSAESKLWGMRFALAEFALSKQYPANARSYAAQCLHCVAWKFSPDSTNCPIQSLILETVGKKIETFIGAFQEGSELRLEGIRFSTAEVCDCISLLGVLGSAAALKGGLSSKTADRVLQLVLSVACDGILCAPSASTDELDLRTIQYADMALTIRVTAASSLGSIFNTDKPAQLWKQRLIHLASKHLYTNFQEASDFSVGELAAVGNLLCLADLRTILSPQMQVFARVLVRGLSLDMLDQSGPHAPTVMKVTLAAIVKLLSFASSSVNGLEYRIVVGAMRAFVKADEFGSLSCKLLALQTIQTVASLAGIHRIVKEVKGPVVSILGAAMNHPSGLLRQTCVEVRNTWLLIE